MEPGNVYQDRIGSSGNCSSAKKNEKTVFAGELPEVLDGARVVAQGA